MAKLSRQGDSTAGGGKIVRGSSTVFANGKPVGLHQSSISPHPSGSKHKNSKTTGGSPSVFADGVPVLRVGSSTSCGHAVNQGADNVFVP